MDGHNLRWAFDPTNTDTLTPTWHAWVKTPSLENPYGGPEVATLCGITIHPVSPDDLSDLHRHTTPCRGCRVEAWRQVNGEVPYPSEW